MEWKDIGEMVGRTAPLLGTLLAPLTGGTSVAIGGLISAALGTDNNPDAIAKELKNNPDAMLKLKELELANEADLRAQVIKLNEIELDRYKTAHQSYQVKGVEADSIADSIINYNLPIIAILVLVNIALVYFMRERSELIAIASNIIGVAIGNLFNERQAIINFFFGSSIGSKEKDRKIEQLTRS
jgi:uncharacterized membrane protein